MLKIATVTLNTHCRFVKDSYSHRLPSVKAVKPLYGIINNLINKTIANSTVHSGHLEFNYSDIPCNNNTAANFAKKKMFNPFIWNSIIPTFVCSNDTIIHWQGIS